MAIGNQTDAQRVLYGQGRYLGEGCTRTVYLLNGVVYKVGVSLEDDYVNSYEYDKACELRNSPTLPDDVRIPEFSIYTVRDRQIIATEYIDGLPCTDYCVSKVAGKDCNCADAYGQYCLSKPEAYMLEDISYDSVSFGNTYYRNGYFYIVDLG